MKFRIVHFLPFLLLIILIQSCSKHSDVVFTQPDANTFPATIAADWMELTRQIVKTEAKNPPQASRVYAYAGITVYESVVAGMSGYQSLQGQIPGLTNMPDAASSGQIDFPMAVNEAMYQLDQKIFGTILASNLQQIQQLHSKWFDDRLKVVDYKIFQRSVEYGKQVAAAIIDRANNDNFSATRTLSYNVPSHLTNPSAWAPTNAVLSPLEPYWGKIKCFTMATADECETPQALAFSIAPGSSYYNQAKEVLTVSQNLTTEQRNIALWWADGGNTPTPPGHWVAIENQMVGKLNLRMGKAAEMYVLMGMTMADAFISCWDAKYKFNMVRPQTYIREFISGNNGWSPLIVTPPFPEYPSGHSVASGAAAEVMTSLFGNVAFTDNTNVSMGLPERSFSSFNDAANEAAISRMYAGIHFREANENGIKQGKLVGKGVMTKIKLKR